MPSFTLTDVGRDLWVENFAIDAASVESPSPHTWSVTKRSLRGGRRDGVDLIQVNNGLFTFSVVPTRGMGLWKGQLGGDRVGWDSPVGDGPVNPAFVNLMNWGGLGWLEGFDELVARCGLENNGAPYEEKVTNPDGSERHTTYGLHGKIANIPASFVAVHVGTEPPYEIVVEGQVEESKLFAPQIRMTTRVSTTPGSNRLTVRDEFLNLKDAPGEMQVLYHWNFGPPYLEAGSRFVAPVKAMAPRDAWAGTAIDHYETYRGPEPGFTEQCYFFELQGSRDDGRTVTMLRNKAGDKGVVLRFSPAQLPAFTLWKCTGGLKEGYVTGLEPGTNYPNPKPFEKARQRVVALPAHGRYVTETTLEVLSTAPAVAAVEAEIQAIQAQINPTIHRNPTEPYGPLD
ncbi:protein of unknown function [Singulisphaera sp. GP187]|uniref:aldose 1-epimerase family protein n=1 Tax=Singulisphaera sp. GP187 TaxID=1882752 RepID=UPI000926953F|nr:aldose 1-epimerase family protein [Singulisphaera sp. GP187]SIO58983.1 protein of unknown function [Singulisphaera sp. GP187]